MRRSENPTFVDLFAGCGGLSLGLFEAGWQGLFAIERDARAFATLERNLFDPSHHQFAWPEWLPRQATTLEDLLLRKDLRAGLEGLAGRVDMLAGGPPCQGFSVLGRRKVNDPRNQLFRQYLHVVDLLKPSLVLIENVRGISQSFTQPEADMGKCQTPTNYAEVITEELTNLGYLVWRKLIFASDYGVPQVRPRYIFVAARKVWKRDDKHALVEPFELLRANQKAFLQSKFLRFSTPVTAGEALSDLETPGHTIPCRENPIFMQGCYGEQTTAYQRLMHQKCRSAEADSHRLARHRPETVQKFQWFLDNCIPGRRLDVKDRGPHVTKKHSIHILNREKPAPTINTLPDDVIHYCEPRILTVRESARLQSFPDWYEFCGKYTTGGKNRIRECPRYTQVGNAVPPLLAEALGTTLKNFLTTHCNQTTKRL